MVQTVTETTRGLVELAADDRATASGPGRIKAKPRALAAVTGIVLMTLLVAPFQIVILKLKLRLWWVLPRLYHMIALRLIGVRVTRTGAPVAKAPVLFVANHVSWLDISILGALVPASFVAKREVDDMGPFAVLARLHRTLFIDRSRRSEAHRQTHAMTERFAAGDNLVLFAEGTSTDGMIVKPFKSALFAAVAADEGGASGLTIQPVSIVYRAINGIPLTRATRPLIGWYGDMALEPHFIALLGLGRITVDVCFHDPVQSGDFPSRKVLAQHCCDRVRAGLVARRGASV